MKRFTGDAFLSMWLGLGMLLWGVVTLPSFVVVLILTGGDWMSEPRMAQLMGWAMLIGLSAGFAVSFVVSLRKMRKANHTGGPNTPRRRFRQTVRAVVKTITTYGQIWRLDHPQVVRVAKPAAWCSCATLAIQAALYFTGTLRLGLWMIAIGWVCCLWMMPVGIRGGILSTRDKSAWWIPLMVFVAIGAAPLSVIVILKEGKMSKPRWPGGRRTLLRLKAIAQNRRSWDGWRKLVFHGA